MKSFLVLALLLFAIFNLEVSESVLHRKYDENKESENSSEFQLSSTLKQCDCDDFYDAMLKMKQELKREFQAEVHRLKTSLEAEFEAKLLMQKSKMRKMEERFEAQLQQQQDQDDQNLVSN
jgi:hypothetical protein